MSDDSFFGMDLPDIQGLIQQLDLFEEKQNEAVRNALHIIGNNIVQAQRRRISGVKVGKRLARYISRSHVYTTQKGVLGISTGYQIYAFDDDEEWRTKPGVIGLVYEFGRPGKSNNTMRQNEYRWWHYVTKNGKTVFMKQRKGIIQPTPHIRLGFDETLEQNVQIMADAINEVIDKL